MKFDDHLDMVKSEAHNILGFIMRNSKEFKNNQALMFYFNSSVVSKLTYCSQIWSPFTLNRIKIFESSQHRFVRFLLYKSGRPMDGFDHEFSPKLEELNLPTIASIHVALSNKAVFKSLNGHINCEKFNNLFVTRNLSYNLRNPLFLETDASFNANYLTMTSSTRMLRLWNKLTFQIRTLRSVNSFDAKNKKEVLSFKKNLRSLN